MSTTVAYPETVLPAGIRSRFVKGVNGLTVHVLEAGAEGGDRPCVLLLHGFPELAYSWRKVMLPIAAAGFHVIAPDQRGYGRSMGWTADYDGELAPFRALNMVRDAAELVSALGYRSVAAVIGHDMGASVAAYCALARPEIFRSLVMMSAPFGGPPATPPSGRIHDELATLESPRKYYQRYFATREANDDMLRCPQGVHDFLRAYYHFKSADWKDNRPSPLQSWTAHELAKMPAYYVMDLDKGMAQTVAPQMPSAAEIAACKWLTEDELRMYSAEYERTGFQGGLQWYRCSNDAKLIEELRPLAGSTIDVPSAFIAGKSDWGIYQRPGNLERMQRSVCTRMLGVHLLEGAGHWVQQEQAEKVSELLIRFLRRA
jgi:pimeloyl-ACP methyl ester carboxylesterase